MAGDERLTPAPIHQPAAHRLSGVRRRLFFAGLSVVAVMVVGVVGYYYIGQAQWSLLDCAYMVLITITTVGYAEILPVADYPYGRVFTMGLVASGMGISIYFLSSLTAFIIEGDLRRALWRRRVHKRLDKTRDHFIVCGVGETGGSVVEELVRSGQTVVVIETDPSHIERLERRVETPFIAIEGDATEDEVLLEAGVERAQGIVATLHTDRDNLFVVVTARQLRHDLRIISRAVDERAGQKLLRAGADAVVSPNQIGGHRMAHELLRPGVVGFIDVMIRHSQRVMNVEEIVIGAGSPLAHVPLARAGIRELSGALVLSVLDGDRYRFNPPEDLLLREGMVLFALGDAEGLARLKVHAQGEAS